MKSKIIVLDIETTGFNHDFDVILELGIVELDLDSGSVKPLYDKVFGGPKLKASHRNSWIFENKYMTHDEVRGKDAIENHVKEIQEILNPYKGRITAWNRPFDAGFLKSIGLDLGKDCNDPMRESTNFFKIPSARGFKWPKAQEAWDILFPETPRTEIHRGCDDADMEAIIINELLLRGVYKL